MGNTSGFATFATASTFVMCGGDFGFARSGGASGVRATWSIRNGGSAELHEQLLLQTTGFAVLGGDGADGVDRREGLRGVSCFFIFRLRGTTGHDSCLALFEMVIQLSSLACNSISFLDQHSEAVFQDVESSEFSILVFGDRITGEHAFRGAGHEETVIIFRNLDAEAFDEEATDFGAMHDGAEDEVGRIRASHGDDVEPGDGAGSLVDVTLLEDLDGAVEELLDGFEEEGSDELGSKIGGETLVTLKDT